MASGEILDFLSAHDVDVYLAVFDKDALDAGRRFGAVQAYIDQHYVDEHTPLVRKLLASERAALYGHPAKAPREEPDFEMDACFAPMAAPAPNLNSAVDNQDEPFSMALLRLIDLKGKTDAEVYKRANIDRRLFSKIRTNRHYMPGKRTVLALVVALELSLEETKDLLARAGYALSRSQKFDVIVEYFLQAGHCDVFEINETLFYYDQPLLGS
jgi:hypothetical protein